MQYMPLYEKFGVNLPAGCLVPEYSENLNSIFDEEI